jgi:hydroxymethylpyrimidine pyrophosphatase-like HAD family hydrolase
MVMPLREALHHEPTKVAVNGLGADLSGLASVLKREVGDSIAIAPANGYTFLNIVSPLASKSQALAHLLEPAGIPLGDVIAFGDDLPDLDLLSAVGMPIAMANAVPEIHFLAKFITASNDEDGVAFVLEQIVDGVSG